MDIEFIRDDSEKERTSRINEILETINKNPESERRLNVGMRFLYALFLSAKELKDRRVEEIEREQFKKKEIKIVKEQVPIKIEEELITPVKKVDEREEKLKSMENGYVVLKANDMNIVSASLVYDEKLSKLNYILEEPRIKEEVVEGMKKEFMGFLKNTEKLLNDNKLIEKKVKNLCKKYDMEYKDEYIIFVKYYLQRDLLNFGEIDGLMHDDKVKSIICDGLYKAVRVEYMDEVLSTNIVFDNENELNSLIERFAEKLKIKLSKEKPDIDGIYKGFRIQATFGINGLKPRFLITKSK